MSTSRSRRRREAPLQVRIEDCGEPLVDLADFGLAVAPAYHRLGLSPDPVVRARLGVAQRLLQAQAGLPAGLRWLVWDGWRPRAVQRALYADFRRQLHRRHPAWDTAALEAELHRFVAPPDRAGHVPPHLTGGAVDLTLVDARGVPLDMGTGFDELTPLAHTASPDIDAAARRHRGWLIDALRGAGFTNWPDEWWHWGYGDPASARLRGESRACYGAIEALDTASPAPSSMPSSASSSAHPPTDPPAHPSAPPPTASPDGAPALPAVTPAPVPAVPPDLEPPDR